MGIRTKHQKAIKPRGWLGVIWRVRVGKSSSFLSQKDQTAHTFSHPPAALHALFFSPAQAALNSRTLVVSSTGRGHKGCTSILPPGTLAQFRVAEIPSHVGFVGISACCLPTSNSLSTFLAKEQPTEAVQNKGNQHHMEIRNKD